jgi:hypothetical protein
MNKLPKADPNSTAPIWVSSESVMRLYSTTSVKPPIDFKDDEQRTHHQNMSEKITRGELLARDELHNHILVSEKYHKRPKEGFADYVSDKDIFMVSERVKEAMEPYTLGNTVFHEMPILEPDGVTPVPGGPWFVLNSCEHRSCFVIEQDHKNVTTKIWRQERYAFLGGGPDQPLNINGSECRDVDLWRDPELSSALFFSDRLHKMFTDSSFYGDCDAAKMPLKFFPTRII